MKYRLTEEKKEWCGVVLHRIECVTPFGWVKAGDKGGWVEKEGNLSQDGNAWVYGDAWVYGNARVHGNAEVYGNARVHGNAEVFGDAWVHGYAKFIAGSFAYKDTRLKKIVYGKIGYIIAAPDRIEDYEQPKND